jgi:hypothetical protein
MAERDVNNLTLRELFNSAERLTRELIEHLEQGFLFKSRSLARLVAATPGEPEYEQIEDLTIRNQVDDLLKSEDFTEQLYRRLEQYYRAIDENVTRISTGG